MTPAEFVAVSRAAVDRLEEDRDFAAAMTAHLLNISGKRGRRHGTADDLLGRPTHASRRAAAEYKAQKARKALEEEGGG